MMAVVAANPVVVAKASQEQAKKPQEHQAQGKKMTML